MNSDRSVSFRPMHTPQQPRLEYEVAHHQNGPHQISVTTIGIFSTLRHAQHAAKEALSSALNHYIARGFCGYYCDDIDLDHRGLITGLVDREQYVALSEMRIHVREAVAEPVHYKPYGVGNNNFNAFNASPGFHAGHNNIYHNTYYNTALPAAPRMPNFAQQQATNDHATGTFSQTRPPFPNRPLTFIPRVSMPYDETMTLPSRTTRSHVQPFYPPPPPPPIAKPNRHGRRTRSSHRGRRGVETEVEESMGESEGDEEDEDTDVGVGEEHGDEAVGDRQDEGGETEVAGSGRQFVGNALGGGVGIGQAYVGRRHSSLDMREARCRDDEE